MRFSHIGLGVRDIRQTMDVFRETLGVKWGPLEEFETVLRDSDGLSDRSRARIVHGLTGDGLDIELSQCLEGETPDTLLLGSREGVSHIAFEVDDLAAERARLLARGFRIGRASCRERV